MPNRKLEANHIPQFLRLAGVLRFNESNDGPDCLLALDERLIGIEHTEFFFPPDLSEQPSDKKLDELVAVTVKEARWLFCAQGGPPLYVSVEFVDRQRPKTTRDARRRAKKQAELVAQN